LERNPQTQHNPDRQHDIGALIGALIATNHSRRDDVLDAVPEQEVRDSATAVPSPARLALASPKNVEKSGSASPYTPATLKSGTRLAPDWPAAND
jgi:hypothetical protein